jgi:PTH1 family peptidyl-tRNA hydrolase
LKLIIGLGNVGEQYSGTFHNMGFWAVDLLAKKLGLKFNKPKCRALVAEGFVGGEKIALAKPSTYMNLSGQSVRELMGAFAAAPADIIVLYDDIDIKKGGLRLRLEGSAGTHNGMKNIIECIKTEAFFRIRMGIGKPEGEILLSDYVLSRIAKADYDTMCVCADRASEACVELIDGAQVADVMQRYNG